MAIHNKLILIVEANAGDVRLFREAFTEIGARHDIIVANDGDAVLELLAAKSSAGTARLPDVIFLALRLPKVSAAEVLSKIKNDPLWGAIPLVVFYNSAAPAEIAEAEHLGADCCVHRPEDFDEFCDLLIELDRRWLASPAR